MMAQASQGEQHASHVTSENEKTRPPHQSCGVLLAADEDFRAPRNVAGRPREQPRGSPRATLVRESP